MQEKYKKLRDYAVDLICRNFDVEEQELLSNKKAENVVDARCALVHCLDFQGIPPCVIEKWTGITVKNQAYFIQGFNTRKRSSPWFDIQMINLIRDAKQTCPVQFRAHNKNGEVVEYEGITNKPQ